MAINAVHSHAILIFHSMFIPLHTRRQCIGYCLKFKIVYTFDNLY